MRKCLSFTFEKVATGVALALVLAFGMALPAQASGMYSQAFNESGVGNFSDIQIFVLPSQGTNLDLTGLNNGWTGETHNPYWSEASGSAVTSENFSASFDYSTLPGYFDMFAFNGGTMVDSARCNFSSGSNCTMITDPLSNASAVYASDKADVPEPSTFLLLVAGLVALSLSSSVSRRFRARGQA